MSINRHDARRDSNEHIIVHVLQSFGASVHRMNTPLDLLVGYKGVTYLIEVKTATGTLTANQKAFIKEWRGHYAIVRTADEALAAIGVVI